MVSAVQQCIALLLISAFLLPISVPARSAIDLAVASSEPTLLSSVIAYAATTINKIVSSRTEQSSGMPKGIETPGTDIRRPQTKAEREAKVHRLEVNVQDDITVESGQKLVLTAIPVDKDGNAIHGLVAEWESENTDVVSVNKEGEAWAEREGSAVLTAVAGNKRAIVKMTVVGRAATANARRITNNNHVGRPIATEANRQEATKRTEQAVEAKSAAHAYRSTAVPQEDPGKLPSTEVKSIYSPSNLVGAPPGRTPPGASNPPAAVEGNELPGSSNFSFNVPLVSLPGRGLDAGLTLTYNSRLWNKSLGLGGARMFYDVDGGWPAPGFSIGYGHISPQNDGSYTLIDPDGTRHQLEQDSADPSNYKSTDGTFLTFNTSTNTLTYTDGIKVEYSTLNAYYPTKIIDKNGNYILISYVNNVGPKISSVKDTMGRYVRFYYASNGDIVTITRPGYGGNASAEDQVVRFYYEDLTLNATFQNMNISAPATAHVIKYIHLAGTQMGYRYDYSSYGMIYQIAQLRGMTVSYAGTDQAGTVSSEGRQAALTTYNYPTTASNLTDAPAYTRRTDDWSGRTKGMNDTMEAPYYAFSVDKVNGLSTVTAPDGTVRQTKTIVHAGYWDDGLVKETTVTKSGVVLAKTTIEWDPNSTLPRPLNIYFTNEAGETRSIGYSGYDAYNNAGVVRERDFATEGTPGTELRRTETDYVTDTRWTGRNLLRLPRQVRVIANGVTASRVDYSYDGSDGTSNAVQTTSLSTAVLMHDDTYNPGSSQYASTTNYRGNVTSVKAYANASAGTGATTSTMTYDITGNVVEETVNCCRRKAFTYSSAYQYAYVEAMARGDAGQLTTSASYDFNTGLLRSTIDENNQTTTTDYNLNSYPNWQKTTRPDGGYSRVFNYSKLDYADPDEAHRHSAVFTETYLGRDASLESNFVRQWQYLDGRGATVRSFVQTGDGGTAEAYAVSDIEYDLMGRSLRSNIPYYVSLGAQSPISDGLWTTVTEYDGLSRAKSVTLPDGTSVQTVFAGTVTTVTDQAGRQRRQTRDALGRVQQVVEPGANGSADAQDALTTAYEYDALDNLTRITQGEQVRKFKYDSLGQMTHQKQVEATATLNDNGDYVGAGSGLWTAVAKYDNRGLLTDAYDARGVHTVLAYNDGLNRVNSITYLKSDGTAEGTPAVTYTYDEAHTGYFNKGRLTKVSTAAVGTIPQTVQAYDYNQMGRVVSQKQTVGTDDYTLSYTYGLAGELKTETYPSEKVFKTEYDRALRLKSLKNSADQPYSSSYEYYAHGGLKTENFGNGTVQSFQYNSRLQLEQIKLAQGSNVLGQFDYKYGIVDQTTGAVDEVKNTGRIARVESRIGTQLQWQQRFSYDSVGRLTTGKEVRGDDASQVWRVDYSYNRYGTRKQASDQPSAVPYVPISDTDISTSTNRFTNQTDYDDAGNVTGDYKFRSLQYRYDANNRMKQVLSSDGTVTQSVAVYDGVGQRVQTTENGVTRKQVYDIFGRLVAEYGGESAPEDAGGTKYLMSGHQGASRVVMNNSGAVVARRDYQPFGEEIPGGPGMRTSTQGYGASESTRQKYGKLERDKSELDHADWRKYDSKSGRWTTADPYTGSMTLSDPQSFNRYSYIGNDPINFIDPSGLDPDDPTFGLGPPPPPPGYDPTFGLGDPPPPPGQEEEILDFGDVLRVWTNERWNPSIDDVPLRMQVFQHRRGLTILTLTGRGAESITEDPCNGPSNWNRKLADFRKIGAMIGWDIAGDGTPVNNGKSLSYEDAIAKLKENGFSWFFNMHPSHWGGWDYEGQIDGRWYHLTIYSSLTRQSRTNPRMRTDPKKPPSRITIHCENNYYQPSSWDHLLSFDWL